MKRKLHTPGWRNYLPILEVLTHYRRRDFNNDLVAGTVVGILTIPQAIAYAFLAGLPAQAGLYASLVPMLVYAIFGSSRQLVVGPGAVPALMIAATMAKYADPLLQNYAEISAIVCLEVGAFLLLLRLTRMGGIVNLLSHPVISGFVNAAAILIILSQLYAFMGIEKPQGLHTLQQVGFLLKSIPYLNVVSIGIGSASLLIIWLIQNYGFYAVLPFLRRVGRNHPITRIGPVVATVLSILVVAVFSLDERFSVATVGQVPSGLPHLTIPPFDLTLWINLAASSAMIALVVFIESFSIGTTLAARSRHRLNSHQELIALGAANVSAAFTGAYPVAGSFSRSTVNVTAGARTQMSSVFSMVIIVITLLWFTPLFYRLPHAALAAIIMASLGSVLNLKVLLRNWKIFPHDNITQLVTLFGVLLLDVESGLLLGVLVAVAFLIRRTSRPNITTVGRVGDSPYFRSERHYDTRVDGDITNIRIDENIYFVNANEVEKRVLQLVARRPETRQVLLVCSGINFIDSTGLEALIRINRHLSRMGIRFNLSQVKYQIRQQFKATGFDKILTGDIFFTTDEAVKKMRQRLDQEDAHAGEAPDENASVEINLPD